MLVLKKVGLVDSGEMSLIHSVLFECDPGSTSAGQNEPPGSYLATP